MTSAASPPLPLTEEPVSAPSAGSAWVAAVVWTLLVATLGTTGLAARLASYREITLTGAGVRLNAVKDTVTISFRQWAALPLSLSHEEDIAEFLTAQRPPAMRGLLPEEQAALYATYLKQAPVQRMNRSLRSISQDFGLPFVALIDTQGVLVAGSFDTALGPLPPLLDLSSREYFRQALSQQTGTQFLLGRISSVPGMYFAHRVDVEGQPAAVVAVKQDAEVINKLLVDTEGNIIVLTDDKGVVVLGNRPELLLQRWPSVAAPDEALLRDIYQRVPEALPWDMRPLRIGERAATMTTVNGQDHVLQSAALPGLPLTAWVLAPLDLETPIRGQVLFGTAAVWLFGCLLIWFGWRRLQLVELAMRARREVGALSTAQRTTEQRFSAVFEHASAGYLFFEPTIGITEFNPATMKLFGATETSQLLKRIPWFAPLSPEWQADGRPSRERALELMNMHTQSGARVQSCEWRFCRLDGTPFDCDVAVIALDWDGSPRFCAVVQDITERKQAEAATRDARLAAEAASQTKSSFLANMSHELRTPMNAIIGMTHLALDDGMPPRQRDYIEKAHASAQSLLQILNDILDVSKIEAGHLQLERIEFNVESVVSDMADVLGLKAEEKGLELLFEPAPNLPRRLVGDPMRLRQVLVNLGGNAIKFTDRGEVTIGLKVAAEDADGIELQGWVRDTGLGMTQDEQTRLFQPFMQADNSTTRRFGGTGLGLVICKQLVERMGGKLWVDSEPGRGSTFHFKARFGRADAETQMAAPARAWTADELRGKRALLVDDNAAARDVLGAMLEALGLSVERAASGAQGLELIARSPAAFTWILLDWKMPGMDGVACARQILKQHPSLRPCILLVTAFARDEALRASAGLPLAGVLQKPVTPSTLHECLLRARTNGAQPAPAKAAAPPTLPLKHGARERLKGARILVVEDHPLNRELACELLRRAGMQVVVAENGEEALTQLAQSGPFDGVLMDCQMPVMDGYAATRALRANTEWRQLPVIAMTASALAEDRDRAFASGMNAHITKPIDVELMLQTMADWIDARKNARFADIPAAAVPGPAAPAVAAEASIDTADGLARCIGKLSLYQRVLRGFRDAETSFAADAQSALAEARWDDALRRTHDLKGLSGTIGAHGLHRLSAALHAALVARDRTAAGAAMTLACAELAVVLREIETLLPTE